MTTQASEKQLKILIKESVQEGIRAELAKLRAAILPYVSEKEQKEIERLYKKPSRRVAKTCQVEL